jgi:hypothetical protein
MHTDLAHDRSRCRSCEDRVASALYFSHRHCDAMTNHPRPARRSSGQVRRKGCRSALLVCALSCFLPLAIHAQMPPPADSLIVPGARLRLQLADQSRSFDGRLRELRGDTLVVEQHGVETRVPAAQVTGIQVQRRAPTLSRNVTIGGVLGMLGGSAMYIDWCVRNRDACRSDIDSGNDPDPYDDEEESPLTMGVISVVGGALLGGALGYVLTPIEWVDLDAPLRVGMTSRGGLRVTGSIPFR